jgi:hypothetical protein
MPDSANLHDYVKYRVRLEHSRGRQISDFEIFRATTMTAEFIEKFFNEGPLQEDVKEADTKTPDVYFVSQLPHPDLNRPSGVFRTGDALLHYYENQRTIGSVVASIEPPYRYPQAIVVLDDQRPLLIIRTEQNALGKLFLCSHDANGRHTNWGEVPLMSRDDFVRKAGELLLQLKYGEEGQVEMKTLDKKSRRPSTYELASQVASVIDAFIESEGVSDFASNRLHVIIDKEYRVSISEPRFGKNVLISVPLSDLKLELRAIREGGPLRHIAVDMAARLATTRLE